MKTNYGMKVIRPEFLGAIEPPTPPTAMEIAAEKLRRGLFLGLVGIGFAVAVTVAPVQAVSAFVIAFVIGIAHSR